MGSKKASTSNKTRGEKSGGVVIDHCGRVVVSLFPVRVNPSVLQLKMVCPRIQFLHNSRLESFD